MLEEAGQATRQLLEIWKWVNFGEKPGYPEFSSKADLDRQPAAAPLIMVVMKRCSECVYYYF